MNFACISFDKISFDKKGLAHAPLWFSFFVPVRFWCDSSLAAALVARFPFAAKMSLIWAAALGGLSVKVGRSMRAAQANCPGRRWLQRADNQ